MIRRITSRLAWQERKAEPFTATPLHCGTATVSGTTAHSLGVPTTSTIMYGHLETARDCAEHINVIREVQKETGGITEFVPLSFIHTEAPMFQKSLVPGIRAGATRDDRLNKNQTSQEE